MNDDEETDEVFDTVTRIEDSVATLMGVVMFAILCVLGLILGSLIAWVVLQVSK